MVFFFTLLFFFFSLSKKDSFSSFIPQDKSPQSLPINLQSGVRLVNGPSPLPFREVLSEALLYKDVSQIRVFFPFFAVWLDVAVIRLRNLYYHLLFSLLDKVSLWPLSDYSFLIYKI